MVVPELTLPVMPAVTAHTNNGPKPGKRRKSWLKRGKMEKGCGKGPCRSCCAKDRSKAL